MKICFPCVTDFPQFCIKPNSLEADLADLGFFLEILWISVLPLILPSIGVTVVRIDFSGPSDSVHPQNDHNQIDFLNITKSLRITHLLHFGNQSVIFYY